MFRQMPFRILILLSLMLVGLLPLPAAAQPMPSPAPAAAASNTAAATLTYIVRPGDTLAGIAARFGTTVSAIRAANPEIANANRIYIGQRLLIPVAAGPSASRITFAAGATSAIKVGGVSGDVSDRYVFRASGGQVALIDLTSNGDGRLAIRGANGSVVLSRKADLSSFRAPLATTQDYYIDVYSATGKPVPYNLQVVIPERISFAAGAISAQRTGAVPGFGTHNYILRASAGQQMTVNVQPAGQVILIVYGNDGSVLQSDHAGSSSFSGRLPYTEDYFLDVRSAGAGATQYRISVRIVN
jgi:LysM repeat protein